MAIIDEEKKRRDKNQRTSIYGPRTPLAQAQNRQFDTATNIAKGAANFAEKYLGGAGGRAIARGASSAGSKVLGDINRTRSITGQQPLSVGNPFADSTAEAAEQPARGPRQPEPQQPGPAITPPSSSSVHEPPVQASNGTVTGPRQPDTFRSPHNGIGMSSDGMLAYTGPDGNVRVRMDQDKWNAAGQRVAGARRPQQQGNGYAIENIDKNNDVAAFNRDPVRPTAQIARGPRNTGPVQQTIYSDALRDQVRGPRQVDLAQLGPAGGWGWSSRQRMYNAEQNRELERSQQGLTRRGQDINAASTARGQDIDAANIAGQNAVRGAEIASSQFDLGERQKLADLQQQYAAATKPEERKRLENEIYARMGKPQTNNQVVTVKGVAEDGVTPTQRAFVLDENGNPIREVGNDTGQANDVEDFEPGGGRTPKKIGLIRTTKGLFWYDGKRYLPLEGQATPS